MATKRTVVPMGFGNGAGYFDTHMNKLMNEIKPKNCILNGGFVKQQSSADMTVIYPDMVIGIGATLKEVASGSSATLTAALGTAQVETATVVGTILTGVLQVETATVAGTVGAAGAGNAKVTITNEFLGTPLEIAVAVANNDNAQAVAGKIRTAIGLETTITDHYTVSGATDKVILTAKAKAANDDTLNIAIDNDTCSGLTAAPTSADTTAGVAVGAGHAKIAITWGTDGIFLVDDIDVAEGDNAATVAGKIRTAVGSATGFDTLFTVGGTGADVIITKKAKEANDPNFNVGINNNTCLGLTAAPTSANTTAGVADQTKMAILQVGSNGTVDIKYGTSVPAAQTPVTPEPDADHAKICAIGPIVSTTTTITTALIDNTDRDMSR